MPPNSLFDRQRAALANLRKLVRDRAAGEADVATTYGAAVTEAERDVQKARRLVAATRKRATDDLADDHHRAMADFETYYATALADADKERLADRKKTVNHYSAALEKARSEYQDKTWTVESLREAGDKEAVDRYQDLKRKAAAAGKHVEATWVEAALVLAKARLTREKVTFDVARLPPPTQTDPVGKVQKCLEESDAAAARLATAPLTKLIGPPGTLAMFVLVGGIAAGVCFGFLQWPVNAILTAAWAVVGGLLLRVLIGVLAKRQVRDRGRALGVFLAEADRAVRTLDAYAEQRFEDDKRGVADRYAKKKKSTDDYYEPMIAGLEKKLAGTLARIEADFAKKTHDLTAAKADDTATERAKFRKTTAEANAKSDAELAEAEARAAARTEAATAERDAAWAKLTADWFGGLAAVSATLRELAAFGDAHFPPWEVVARADRALPYEVPPGVRYGTLAVDQYALPGGKPEDERLVPKEPIHTTVPAYLPFPSRCAVVLKAQNEGRQTAVAALQAMMLRFLTGLPPGKVRFTIVDPVGLGENFASFMHLADYDEKLVSARIWTEPPHIEQRLTDLTEHMENVIQKYLRNQYKSIEEYNRAAGEVAEPYRVLVVANFPANFTPDAARRLVSVMSSGPACGVCTLLSVDTRAALPRDFRLSDLEAAAFNLALEGGMFRPTDPEFAPFPMTVDRPPTPEAIAAVVRKVGQASREAARVEVPFEFIAPPPEKVWTGDAGKGFEVPIGRAGATRRQVFAIGRGTAQHALVAGKTGSGKSTLLHALITNLAMIYGPDEAELYLIDFKKGVEFKDYAENRLPHARVVAIESEREFGLSVLQRLDGILRERGDAFRMAGANDLAGYREYLRKKSPGTAVPALCPRILLVVDEFQEFFTEDDKLAQEAALLLDRLVRQGRAFGVHVLLGSQTLGGAYSLARSTIDQMAVRIALQCSEADAQLILSKDNTAARLLNRPGEAIYNDANGLVEGNDPFQVVWLSEEKREQVLAGLRDRANGSYPPPLVFEGNASADVTKNKPLARLVAGGPAAGPPLAWLGDPVAIKDPTAAVFRPQSASNLLLLGQHEDGALALVTSSLVSLAARLRPTAGRPITVLDGTPDDSEFADHLRRAADAIGLDGAVVERAELPAAVAELAAELDRRQSGESADRSPRFLLVHGLHRLRELRKPDDEFGFGRKGEKQATPGEHFATILRDGPPFGIHVIAWCDSLTNLHRTLDRQALKEFALRVLFQMSPADSSHLIDSPLASRLGRTRALFVEEGSERPEKFRPYGLAEAKWLREVGEQLAGVATEGAA